MGNTVFYVIAFAVAAGVGMRMYNFDLLTGFSSTRKYGGLELQAGLLGFCMSPIPGKLLGEGRGAGSAKYNPDDGHDEWDFEQEGDIGDDEYTKSSIYALLYSLYQDTGTILSDKGVPYEFTFNTWGIAPSTFPETDPQRHGKQAYAGLFRFPKVKALLDSEKTPLITEVGCGTGAGAHLISGSEVPHCKYNALDMQQAAIDTCNRLHASNVSDGRLSCTLVSGGVGNNGNAMPAETGSQSVVVISETHIADVKIGPEEKAIFTEIKRTLKPGGFFVWGNALPTAVWHTAIEYLTTDLGFEACGNLNHTKGAVIARDEDEARVNSFCDQMHGKYVAFKTPYFGARCQKVTERLIKNFYRHPGTALYKSMVNGLDSYMHLCFQKPADSKE